MISVNTTSFSEGEDVILFCDVSGVPAPVVSWCNDKNENVYIGSLWKLPSVNRSYSGTYTCEASNGCGKDNKTFDVIVQCKSVGRPDLSFLVTCLYFLALALLNLSSTWSTKTVNTMTNETK